MRFDVEIATAELVAAYLKGAVDEEVLPSDACPVVTFFDPMSVDEADRVVVMVPSADTSTESPGNFNANVECGIKTQWKQKTLAADFGKHFARVKEVRDKLFPSDLIDQLIAASPNGLGVDFVQPRRQFITRISEGWIYSETAFQINCFAKTEI
jgi:hypothetical protein